MKSLSLALLVVLLATTACAHVDAGRVDTRRTAEALSLLREWDHRRSQAWTDGDAGALADLYTRASHTGRRDCAMLAAYAARGLRVTRLRMQVLEASVRSWTASRIRLEVTDRMVGAEAVGGGLRIPLPRDRPSMRVISLRWISGAWRVEEVTDAARPR